jgi:hypothetical protein
VMQFLLHLHTQEVAAIVNHLAFYSSSDRTSLLRPAFLRPILQQKCRRNAGLGCAAIVGTIRWTVTQCCDAKPPSLVPPRRYDAKRHEPQSDSAYLISALPASPASDLLPIY